MTPRRWPRVAALLSAALALAGCERVMRDMYEQPKKLPATASPLFGDGMASRPPPPGSVAHATGDPAATSSGRRGADELRAGVDAGNVDSLPARPSPDLLRRGQERYDIFCVPCHSPIGDGDGPVVRRGFPAPPSYHEPRLVAAPDRHFYDVISNGWGVMFPYADRVAPADRWAIVAYIRALQLSQHAPVASLPAALRAPLDAAQGDAAKAPPADAAGVAAKARP